MRGVGGGLDNLHARRAAAASAPVLAAAPAAPTVAPAAAAARVTTSAAPSGASAVAASAPAGAAARARIAAAGAAAGASAVASRASAAAAPAALAADGRLAALHSCGERAAERGSEELARGPACTPLHLPSGSLLHPEWRAVSDLQRDAWDEGIPVFQVFFMGQSDVRTAPFSLAVYSDEF